MRSLSRYFMFGFFASLFYFILSFYIAVNLLRLSTTILDLFSLLAFINCRNDVVCFIIFRKLLFFDNFRKIQRFILKRRIIFLVIDYFHKRYIFGKYFKFINCQLECGSIIRTLNDKGMTLIRLWFRYETSYHVRNTQLTVCMTTHGKNTWQVVLFILLIAKRTKDLVFEPNHISSQFAIL
mgnify:CR=1 FL=1